MNKNIKYFFCLIFAVIIFLVFKAWFLPGLITAGDLWPNFASMYSNRPIMLYAWDYGNMAGLGGVVSPILWIYLNFGIPSTVLGKLLHLDWSIVERIYFLYPIIILSVFSSFYLFKKLFKNNNFAILSSFLFTFNTYLLMIVGGGQVSIALSYSISPLVFYFFSRLLNFEKNKKLDTRNILYTGLIFSLQFQLDIRIAYVTLVAVLVYWVLKILLNKSFTYFLRSFLKGIIIPGILTIFLHFYWILPTLLNRQNPIKQMGDIYSSISAVRFFSFAKFEDTISLLHPNWPENIFGKTYFMRSEFLLLPILAFISLFFIKKLKTSEEKIYILFFSLLALIGAFLAKGASDPFGDIYLWLFSFFPGVQMFRDPTKWYVLIALSYSILIPFSIWKIYESLKLRPKLQNFIPKLFILLTFLYLVLIIYSSLIGQLGGTFRARPIPQDYVALEKFLSLNKNYGRVLWVPTTERFGYFSFFHPSMPGYDYFKTTDPINTVKKLDSLQTKEALNKSSVKYIIVPYDSEGEIFLDDRKYSEKKYLETISEVKKVSWLEEIVGFGKIKVFELSGSDDHFSLKGNGQIEWKYISPVEYLISVKNTKKGDVLIFSENYNPGWKAQFGNSSISSNQNGQFNSFVLDREGNYNLKIYYQPQKWVNIGIIISLLSLASVLALIFGYKGKKW